MRNLQEQVKKAFCYQKIVHFLKKLFYWSQNFCKFSAFSLEFQKFFPPSLEQFFLTVGQNNFGKKIPRNSGKQIALPSLSWINKVEHDFHVDFMFEHMAIEFTTSVPKTRVPTQNILWYLETNLPQWPKFPIFHLKIIRTFLAAYSCGQSHYA
jgi:hypothetical protein